MTQYDRIPSADAIHGDYSSSARRTFAPLILLWTFRAVAILVVCGSIWLSVRGQHPYSRPADWAWAVAVVTGSVNIGLTGWMTGRAGAGVSSPAQRRWLQPWKAIALAAWLIAYFAMASHYHAGLSHPAWGPYPASAPLLIIGLATAAVAAAIRYWPMALAGLAITVVAAFAGFGGPTGSWLILGVGLCAVYLGIAAFNAWRQRSKGTPEDARAHVDRLAQERGHRNPACDPQTDHDAMPRWAAAALTLVSFPTGPGVVLVLVPWLITRFQEGLQPWPVAVQAFGAALIAAGAAVNVATFIWFPLEGRGVPWPTDPPSSRKVMVRGPYRCVRNPMYVSFFVAITGEALLLSRPALLIYLAVLGVLLAAFVRWWEEPTMAKRFGAEYDAYKEQVYAWWPIPRRRGS